MDVLVHCPRCQKKTGTVQITRTVAANDKPMIQGLCRLCFTRKNTFVKMEKQEATCRS